MDLKDNKAVALAVNDGVATLTITRPEVMNALNVEAWQGISLFADYLNDNDDIRVGVITGSGDKAFIAGADVNMLKERTTVTSLHGFAYSVVAKLETCRKPIVAAINGAAFGGGFEVALACDIRIASDNAVFGLPETSLGIMPAAGATQRLTKMVGVSWTKEMVLTGRRVKADEALRLSIVTRVTKPEDLMAEVKKATDAIKARAPLSLQLSKRIIMAGLSSDQETGLYLEQLGISLLTSTADRSEGLSAFLEKRTPRFVGK